ncbi:MAG: peptide chain release factor 1 [Saprospiraceae bacterium]|nr:peptide chain release factor 1 [Saprospiraceae bacterium]
MTEKLIAIKERFIHLEEQLSDPGIIADSDRYKKVSKDYKKLKPIVAAFDEFQETEAATASARTMLRDEDPEIRAMAQEELAELSERKTELEDRLRLLLIPKDPDDDKDVIFEIRSGTGGDEAALFAGDLYRMYQRYFDAQGWNAEVMEVTEGTVGGYDRLILEVTGEEVYGKIKFESGTHRVQRVPKTESQGRIHTSAATVVVMPKLEMEDVNINKADLKVDTFRASGAGGQHVNKTESGVRFTHLPSGLVTESTEARSQHQNREIALQRLYQRLLEMEANKVNSAMASRRKSIVGSGDRSEKIRTFNFPQNRVTDHRIGLTLHNLDAILDGHIDDLIEALQMADTAERLKEEQPS